ncbi:MAG: hypothetical protein ABSF71_26750 [Terriglobia bacterium]
MPLTTEILALRDDYVRAGVVSPQWLNDAAHVAAVTVARADAIVSWNVKPIVRADRIFPPPRPNRPVRRARRQTSTTGTPQPFAVVVLLESRI